MTELTNETVSALLNLLQQAGASLPAGTGAQPQPAAPAPAPGDLAGGWSQPQTTRVDNLQAVAVPLKLNRANGGNVKVMLLFGPEHAATPDALHHLVDRLVELRLPVDAWSPRRNDDADANQSWDRGGQARREDRPPPRDNDRRPYRGDDREDRGGYRRDYRDDRYRDDRDGYRGDRYRDDRGGDRPRYGNGYRRY